MTLKGWVAVLLRRTFPRRPNRNAWCLKSERAGPRML